MGNAQSSPRFCCNVHKESSDFRVICGTYEVKFLSSASHKLVPLQESISNSCLSMKMLLNFDPNESDPIIGIAPTKNVVGWNDENIILWKVCDGSVSGRSIDRKLPVCVSGAVVDCCLDMFTGKLTVKVNNPGIDTTTAQINLPNLPELVTPFVGVVYAGKGSVSFRLQGGSGSLREKSMTDIIESVAFDTTFGNITVAPSGKRLSRTATQQGNSCALLNKKITCGRWRWKLEITCDFGASFCAGIARYPFRMSEEYIKDPLKHIYRHPGLLVYRSYRGLLYKDGRQMEKVTSPLGWQHNSNVTLEFEVDMDSGTLTVFKNGVSLGVAFTDIVGPVVPVVCFYASYEKDINLLTFLSSEVAQPVNAPTIPPVSESYPAVTKSVCFDPANKFGDISLSEDLKTVYRKKNQAGNSFCLLNINCTANGIYCFSFVVENDQGASTCIGVTQETECRAIKLSDIGNIYTSESFYFYRSFQGMIYSKGNEQPKRLDEYWMSGTLVEMKLEIACNRASVYFTVNGKDQGTAAFSGLQSPLTPVVSFYAGMEKRVTLIHFQHETFAKSHAVQNEAKLNDLNTDRTASSKSGLPIIAKPLDSERYCRYCKVCKGGTDVIFLPCKHTPFCAKHTFSGGNRVRSCPICGEDVLHVWNILTF